MFLNVNNDKITKMEDEIWYAGSIGYYEVNFVFNSAWNGLNRELVVSNKYESQVIQIVNDKAYVPKTDSGVYLLGVLGYTLDENDNKVYQISTNVIRKSIKQGSGEVESPDIKVEEATALEIYINEIKKVIDSINVEVVSGLTLENLQKAVDNHIKGSDVLLVSAESIPVEDEEDTDMAYVVIYDFNKNVQPLGSTNKFYQIYGTKTKYGVLHSTSVSSLNEYYDVLRIDVTDDNIVTNFTKNTLKFIETAFLATNHTYETPYTPHRDCSPTTKKYVDDGDALKEDVSNKVTTINENSTDTQYPSAKAVYDKVGNVGEQITALGTRVTAVEDIIPSGASSQNKLATDDDIESINEKIPSSASSLNKLATDSDVATRVPITRKINNKTLDSDITLDYEDVGAYSTSDVDTLLGAKVNTSDIINDVVHTDTNKPLSANMGKQLQDEIDNLKARGRFLALWNSATGLAMSNPETSPYTYKTGDYFIVGNVDNVSLYADYDSSETYNTGDKCKYNSLYYVCNTDNVTGEWDSTKWDSHTITNYKPTGSSYTIGVASTVVETNEVAIDDVYYYDGTNWRLQANTQKVLTFANIAGQPSDNTNLAAALNDKVGFDDYASSTKGGVIKIDTNFGATVSALGGILASTKTYEQYLALTNNLFIGKGTLENVITGKNLETGNNKVTSISSSSTDTEYPSAKCVYDIIGDIETILTNLTTGGGVE